MRRIYWSTEKYAAILRGSIQPGALRSGVERDLMLARLCSRRTAPAPLVHAEIAALKRLDIPYFVSKATPPFLPEAGAPSSELISALRNALH
jgi:lantibiotic modifying enzyme